MILYPILASIGAATGTLLEKVVLRKRKINIKLYQTAEFLGITLVMLPFIFFMWHTSPEAFTLKNILILLLIIAVSIIANYLVIYSLKWEKINVLEPVRLTEPLFTILLAILFSFIFGSTLYEKNTKIAIPAIIAATALIISHIKKHHLKFNKYFVAALGGSFFFALDLVTSKLILNHYNPLTFYFVRCSGIFIASWIIFKPDFKNINKKVGIEMLGTSAIWVLYRISLYYGYQNEGIIFTTLILMLGPIFIYLFAWKFLKEKIEIKNVIAAAAILGSILYVILG